MKILIFTLLLLSSGLVYGQNQFNEIITLNTATGTLYGTITVADSLHPTPIVIIIPGSGPTDQNGNSGMAMHTNAYKLLAEALAQNNISSLRYDKRGIGKSYKAAIEQHDLRFEVFIDDVVLWLKQLKSDKRFSSIYLAGHSQGSLIGMVAAQKTAVDGFISIAGAGYSIDKVLETQLKDKLSDSLYQESVDILSSLKEGQKVDSVSPWLYNLFRPAIQPYMISWIKYAPCEEIQKLTTPLLIINGTTDLQVSVDNAERLHEASEESQLLLIENMNHVLKEAPIEQKANMATYIDGQLPLVPKLVDELVLFISKTKK
ncbi:alpha/beta fold hydrolase [Carboxylicivirga sp. A043]|uniref:alpha/beta hydrolase n=1 Tax=Carboxylicivirga litoralis TaxID=2816963 RepID=UPI0021CB350D|nr:lysophospholipase [Carboxylicivirga sp. A043]MCU4157466.1 alpha/beta fold hydrolase [Carboxylicivirga sp. A043]